MSRIAFASRILKGFEIEAVLDVGCRQGDLADHVASGVRYVGADLFPDKRGRVKYLGDISKLDIPETFDAVVALDILEHLESPSKVFDKLVGWSNRYLLVSLPNCYDLKSRFRFAKGGPLGGKYLFSEEEPIDRHRWLMTRGEVVSFYEEKARKHGMELQVIDLRYGTNENPTMRTVAGRILTGILPASMTTETVCGLFTKG